MASAKAGWLDDGSGQLRWWDGTRWTTYYFDARTGAVVDRSAAPDAAIAVSTTTPRADPARVNLRAAVITASVIIAVLLVAWPSGILLLAGIGAGAVGLYALIKGSFAQFRIRRRSVGAAVLVAGLLVSSIGGAALAVGNEPTPDTGASVASASDAPRDTPPPTPTPKATPTPTPVRTETIVEERAPIAFISSTVDDPNLDVGNTVVATPGANGERLTRIRVVTEDGREVSRAVVEEVVTLEPVDEVIAVGSRQPAPPPPPPPPADNGCDPNYEGACVPIAPDVDCAGGSGNGPAYVDGPVWVVGSDIYDLDRDGDGIACDA